MQIETEIVKKIEKNFGIVQVFVLNNANKMKAMGRSLCDWVLKASEKYLSKTAPEEFKQMMKNKEVLESKINSLNLRINSLL